MTRGWQPIETAPKDGTFVHLWFPHNGTSLSDLCLTCRWRERRDGSFGWFSQNGGRSFLMENPSHWSAIEPPTT